MSPTISMSRPLGIGTRTEIRLDEHHLVSLTVRAGELLRSEEGLVWATVDGKERDILLDRGHVHVVERDVTLRVSAFGRARLEIYGNGPLWFDWPQHKPAGAALTSVWDAVVSRVRGARAGRRPSVAPSHAA